MPRAAWGLQSTMVNESRINFEDPQYAETGSNKAFIWGRWKMTNSSEGVFSSFNQQGPSFTEGVRLLQGKMSHCGKVPLSGFGGTSMTSFLFTHSERRSECCWSTFKTLEMCFGMNFQFPLYPFLFSLVRDDETTNSRECLETWRRTMVE